MSLEANTGVAPKLFAITLGQPIGGVTLKGLNFESPLAGKSNNGAVYVSQQGSGTGAAPITITGCNFKQTGNTNNGWLNSVYIRANASGTYGKITVADSNFDMTAALTTTDVRGITTILANNWADVEVRDNVFLGGMRGVFEDNNVASPSMVGMNIHNNLFYAQNFTGYGKHGAITSGMNYLTVENNTFVKIRDRVNGYGSGGAINLRGATNLTGVIKDNLIVDDDANAANAGLGWLDTSLSGCNADYNAFVAMTGNKVAFWNNADKTITDLNGLTNASNNQLNDTLTPANLFANYGGTDYRNAYKLKAGVWALTAASDGQFVGAFAAVPEPSAAMLLAPGALMALRRKKRN